MHVYRQMNNLNRTCTDKVNSYQTLCSRVLPACTCVIIIKFNSVLSLGGNGTGVAAGTISKTINQHKHLKA